MYCCDGSVVGIANVFYLQVLEYMCHKHKDTLEDKQPSPTIHILASTPDATPVLIMATTDLISTAVPTGHHIIVTLVHLQNPMEVYIVATFMT